jgi:hypothetical protein
VRRNAALAAAALAGAALGAALARARRPIRAPRPEGKGDPRADELRRKLAEARTATAEEDDFEAAGMGAETIVDEPPRRAVVPETPLEPEASPPPSAAPAERSAADEFEAMRRRIHEEGRAAAEEMRRAGDPPAADR